MKRGVQIVLGLLFLFVVFFPECISGSKAIVAKCGEHVVMPVFSDEVFTGCDKVYIRPIVAYDPHKLDLKHSGYKAPSYEHGHYLGTDELGRDTLAGLIHGFSSSMKIGLGASLIALVLGFLLALPSGYYFDDKRETNSLILVLSFVWALLIAWWMYYFSLRTQWGITLVILLLGFIGWGLLEWMRRKWNIKGLNVKYTPDILLLRLADAYELLPKLILLLVFFSVFTWQAHYLMILLGLIGWPFFFRNLRIQIIRVKALPYMQAARVQGIPVWRQLLVYMLPAVLSVAFSLLPFMFVSAVLAESSLSFIGLGLGPENITLGKMISEGRNFPQAWWLLWFPIGVLCVSMFIISLWGLKMSRYWALNK